MFCEVSPQPTAAAAAYDLVCDILAKQTICVIHTEDGQFGVAALVVTNESATIVGASSCEFLTEGFAVGAAVAVIRQTLSDCGVCEVGDGIFSAIIIW